MITNYNDFLNEGLIDKMKPKTKEEILNYIGDVSHLKYESLPFNKMDMSSLVGTVSVSYDDLVKLFGKPHEADWSYKTNFEWFIISGDKSFRIYDWKIIELAYEYGDIEIGDNDTIEEMKEKAKSFIKKQEKIQWMIGGYDKGAANDLKKYILYNTYKNKD